MLKRKQKHGMKDSSSFGEAKNELGRFKNPEENLDGCVRSMIADKVTPEGVMPDEVYEMAIEARNMMTSIGCQARLANDRDEYLRIKGSEWLVANALVKMVYTQQTEYDPDIALFARASLARGEGRWKAAKQDYETLLQRHPDFTRGRLDYARLLFEGRLNREATSEFMRLQNEDLPEAVKENIGHFRDSLNQRQSWQGSLSVGAVHNSNINEASGKTWCKTEIDGECWEEFSGDKPISANGIKYEAAAVRRWQIKGHHGIAARALGYGRFYRDHKDFNEHTLNLSAGYQFENHRHTFALAPLVEWNGSGGKTLNRAYGVRSEWNLDKGSWTWNTEAEWKHLSYSDKTRLLDGNLISVYNTLSYFPRNDLMLYGGIDWQQRKAKEPVDSYRLISARLGAAKMFEAGFDASASATFGIRSHREENAVLEQRRRDKEQTYRLSIGADRWKFAGMKLVLSYKHCRVKGNTDPGGAWATHPEPRPRMSQSRLKTRRQRTS